MFLTEWFNKHTLFAKKTQIIGDIMTLPIGRNAQAFQESRWDQRLDDFQARGGTWTAKEIADLVNYVTPTGKRSVLASTAVYAAVEAVVKRHHNFQDIIDEIAERGDTYAVGTLFDMDGGPFRHARSSCRPTGPVHDPGPDAVYKALNNDHQDTADLLLSWHWDYRKYKSDWTAPTARGGEDDLTFC